MQEGNSLNFIRYQMKVNESYLKYIFIQLQVSP